MGDSLFSESEKIVRLNRIIAILIDNFKDFARDESGEIVVTDPDFNREIGSHYALSHYMAAFYVLGSVQNNAAYTRYADRLLEHILRTQREYVTKADYHNDFNNFAWALLWQLDRNGTIALDESVRSKLTDLLLSTDDSNHETVNWLCMRAFNNFTRQRLTSDARYGRVGRECLKKVCSAVDDDGYIEDRIPRGTSANLQYHLFSLAVLQLARQLDVFSPDERLLRKALNFSLLTVAPDGDCNYFGRGCNQIFAWGPMFYLLNGVSDQLGVKRTCYDYFMRNFANVQRHTLLVENDEADQSQLVWDYHYVTVYQAHLLLWTALAAVLPPGGAPVDAPEPLTGDAPHRIAVHRHAASCVIRNAGTRHYLCETGPVLVYLSLRRGGVLFKGAFGPYFSPFGNRNISKFSALTNNIGLYRERSLLGRYTMKYCAPCGIDITQSEASLELTLRYKRAVEGAQFVFPILQSAGYDPLGIIVEAAGTRTSLHRVMTIQALYGAVEVYKTAVLPKTAVVNVSIRV